MYFYQNQKKFLGCEVLNGCTTPPHNPTIEIIKKLKQPTHVKELQSTLRSINWGKLIPQYAKI